jgi:hypothetical protein
MSDQDWPDLDLDLAHAERRANRRLARELRMPRRMTPVWAPALQAERTHGARWAGWTVDMFGARLIWTEPTGPAGWLSYVDGGVAAALEAGDPDWRTRGNGTPRPSVGVDAWLIQVRRVESPGYVEARRGRDGTWAVAVQLGTSVRRKDADRLLPGLTLLRQITRRGGRPRGRAKHDAAAVDAWIGRWRRRTTTRGWPGAKVLAAGLRVSETTAGKYLREAKAARGKSAN